MSVHTINDRQMAVEPKIEEVSLSLSGSKVERNKTVKI